MGRFTVAPSPAHCTLLSAVALGVASYAPCALAKRRGIRSVQPLTRTRSFVSETGCISVGTEGVTGCGLMPPRGKYSFSSESWQNAPSILAVQAYGSDLCSTKPCWIQRVLVAVAKDNPYGGRARAAVYTKEGDLIQVSDAVLVPRTAQDSWLELPFTGKCLELSTESAEVWLAVKFEEKTTLVFDEVKWENTTRLVDKQWSQDWNADIPCALQDLYKNDGSFPFPLAHNWLKEQNGRYAEDRALRLRMQLHLGAVSVLSGSLPIVLEAPHGGRITAGFSRRSSGNMISDFNSDLFVEQLRKEVGRRCGGRKPRAVIFRVHRQGIDSNRAKGTDAQNGKIEYCCHLTKTIAQNKALGLWDEYQTAIKHELSAAGDNAVLVSIHGTTKSRVEIGMRIGSSYLNKGAQRRPHSLQDYDEYSSLRALGNATSLLWGSRSLGTMLATARPGLEVMPSAQFKCPDKTICPGASDPVLFTGGYSVQVYHSATRPSVQVELPPSMRKESHSLVPVMAVVQVGAAVAAFLNDHYGPQLAKEDPSFRRCEEALDYGTHTLGTDVGTMRFATAESRSPTRKQYLYWQRFNTDLSTCGNGCQAIMAGVRMRCDSPVCDKSVPDGSYTAGMALYDASGLLICHATSEERQPATESTDWWLQVSLQCARLLRGGDADMRELYLGVWFSKPVKLWWNWQGHFREASSPKRDETKRYSVGRTHSCTYDSELFHMDPTAQSPDACVDQMPPAMLPSWRDSACEDLAVWKCKTWTIGGVQSFYGIVVELRLLSNFNDESTVSIGSVGIKSPQRPAELLRNESDPSHYYVFEDMQGEKELRIDNAITKCCCIEVNGVIECELVQARAYWGNGCRQIKGDRYHSWNNMPKKYMLMVNYGRCAVRAGADCAANAAKMRGRCAAQGPDIPPCVESE